MTPTTNKLKRLSLPIFLFRLSSYPKFYWSQIFLDLKNISNSILSNICRLGWSPLEWSICNSSQALGFIHKYQTSAMKSCQWKKSLVTLTSDPRKGYRASSRNTLISSTWTIYSSAPRIKVNIDPVPISFRLQVSVQI